MKLSDYLWARIQFDTAAPKDMTPYEVQGQFDLSMDKSGDIEIINDVTGKKMNRREANSVYGRNTKALNKAYKMGARSLFDKIAIDQQISDEEWEKAKSEAEAAEQEQSEAENDG